MRRCLACSWLFEADTAECPKCHHTPEMKDGFYTYATELNNKTIGFPGETAYQHLFEVESNNFWFRSRNRLIAWAMEKYFSSAKTFLEVGCGTGFVLSELEQTFPKLETTGSEAHSAGLRYAKKRLTRTQLMQMDARNIPFVEEYDVVGAFDVLEHIENDQAVLQQMHATIKPGGGAIITVPQHKFLWSSSDEYACHERRYSRNELLQKVTKAGFVVEKVTSFVSFLLPAMFLSRLGKNKLDENFDPTREFDISPAINIILEQVCNFERLLIQAGISFPAGGSLMLVVKKRD